MTYAEAIKAESRTLTTRGTLTPSGSIPINLTSSHIVDWAVDEGEEFPLGSVMSTSYTLKLANPDNEWSEGGSIRGENSLMGATVSLELGILVDGEFEYKPIGSFIVEKSTYSEGDPVITLTGSDKLLTDLNDVFDDTLYYPKTVQQLLDFTLSQGSITLDGDYDTLACNASVSIIKAPKWPKGTTIRQVMGYICAVGGCFFRAGRNGQYQIVPVYASTPARSLDTSAYMKLSDDENTFDFNRVKIVFSETDSISSAVNSSIAEKASNTITISDNPICLRVTVANFTLTSDTTVNPKKTYYTKSLNVYYPVSSPINSSLSLYYTRSTTNNNDTVQAIADGLKTYFTGMTLRGMNIRWRGDPLLRIGDRVELTDRRGLTNETMVFKQTLTYKKGLSAVISCDLQDYDSLGLVSAIPDPGVEVGGETPASLDADTLDGYHASDFATSDHNHDADYLGANATAVDSDKLDGFDASGLVPTALFSPAVWEQGRLVPSTGVEEASSYRIRTGYIPVTGSAEYEVVRRIAGDYFYSWYTSALEFISDGGFYNNAFRLITAPATAAFVRFTLKKASGDATTPADVPGVYWFEFHPSLLSRTYPVGAIYMSDASTSPATLFGGTWSSISSPPTGCNYWWKRTA